MRTISLATGEFYHIFNRGVARAPIFLHEKDYLQAHDSLFFYNHLNTHMKFSRFKDLSCDAKNEFNKRVSESDKFVDIVSYVLMPNHFHLLLQQKLDNGISIFLRKFSDSYSRYFNTKYERVGPLFQGAFKSRHIESENQLLHVSRYIHLNPLTSFVANEKNFLSYKWSSLNEYLMGKSDLICFKPITFHFNSQEKYLKFILDQKDYQRRLKQIEHLIIEK